MLPGHRFLLLTQSGHGTHGHRIVASDRMIIYGSHILWSLLDSHKTHSQLFLHSRQPSREEGSNDPVRATTCMSIVAVLSLAQLFTIPGSLSSAGPSAL